MLIAMLNMYLSLAGGQGITVDDCNLLGEYVELPEGYCDNFEASKSDDSASGNGSTPDGRVPKYVSPPSIYNGF